MPKITRTSNQSGSPNIAAVVITAALGLAVIQVVFEFLAKDIAHKNIATVQSYLNDTRTVSNPYLIAQRIEDLELQGIARCSVFKPASQGQEFINLSYKSGCGDTYSPIKEVVSFRFKRADASLLGSDGRTWKVSFHSMHSAYLRIGLWGTRFAFLLFVFLVNYFLKKTLALQLKAFEVERSLTGEIVSLAAQVAHDIRSPLAALGSAAKDLKIPEEQRKLMEGAVGRMQGIADDLLERYRAPGAITQSQAASHRPPAGVDKTTVCVLAGLIEQVLAEKRLQYKDKPGVKIEFGGGADGVKASVEPKEFQRLMSNLINNSIEALEGPGTVSVGLSDPDGRVLIEVKDNGKGIPPGILAKLGQKGETHGKAGGNGLGLYHARTTVESWGGSFKIGSEPGKGTVVVIALPGAATRAVGRVAVLLDDDMLVHMNWKLAAKAAGVELKAYKTPEDFAGGLEVLPKDAPIYIDSDLGNDIKGEDIAKDLREKGFTDITMATGHSPDKFAHPPWLKVTGKEPPFGGAAPK